MQVLAEASRTWLTMAVAAGLVVLMTGCGGGGGGMSATVNGGGLSFLRPDSSRAPPPAVRPASLQADAAPYENDSEYTRAWPLQQVDAATAYARIAKRDGAGTAPGAGARVAVIDTGIDEDHWEFGSSLITKSGAAGTDMEHGTAVSSVIAARRNQTFPGYIPIGDLPRFRQLDFHGIAWGIDHLEMSAVPLGTSVPDQNYEGITVADFDDDVDWFADRFSGLTTSVDFVNMSFNTSGLVENYVGETFGPLYDPAIVTLAQTSTTTGKTILVIAASNDHGDKCASPEPNCVGGRLNATSPAIYAGLPVLEQSLRSHVVAVVATDRQGRIASFSNRCGIAAKWCIAAPGQRVPVATFEEGTVPGEVIRGYDTWNGTSLAAPFVTGGLAVLKHWFRTQLANEELLTRLYETARVTPDHVPAGSSCPAHLDLDGDRSDCELSSALGRGLMDLGAATAPVGMMSFVLGNRVAGGGPPATSSWVSPGRATGDAMSRSLAGHEIALFDSLDAPFWINADRFVQEPTPEGLATRLFRWLAGKDGRDGPAENGMTFGFGPTAGVHAGIVSQPAAFEARLGKAVLSTFASTGSGGEIGAHSLDGEAYGLSLAWRPKDGPAGLHAGWIRETDALFGSGAEGAFGRLSSNLSFIGASGAFEAGGWHVDVAAEVGRAMPDAGGGMLQVADTRAFSSAFSAEAARPLGHGTLRLSLQQPLRVERGSLDVSLPTGRTPEGVVERRRISVGLEPSGRQLDFGVDWTEAILPDAVWRVGAVLSREPGHNAGRTPEVVFLTGLHIRL